MLCYVLQKKHFLSSWHLNYLANALMALLKFHWAAAGCTDILELPVIGEYSELESNGATGGPKLIWINDDAPSTSGWHWTTCTCRW